MTARQLPWKWLVACLAAIIIGALTFLPRVAFDGSSLQRHIDAQLSAWSGGEIRFAGPVSVRYFPDVSVRGHLHLESGSRLAWIKSIEAEEAKISLDLIDLLRGRLVIKEVRLTAPRIVAVDAPQDFAGSDPEIVGALVDALFGQRVAKRFVIQDGEIKFRTASGGQAIKALNLQLRFKGAEKLASGSGSLFWRDEEVRFFVEAGHPGQGAPVARAPLTLNVSSAPITVTLTGAAVFGERFGLEGRMRASGPKLRAFLNWSGAMLPPGRGLGDFAAAGSFQLSGTTIAFDDVALALDGNEGIGVLAVRLGPGNPRFEGTLDFHRLSLAPYLHSVQPAQSALGPDRFLPLDWSLLRHLDADLRISADWVEVGSMRLGRAALTIGLQNRVLLSEVSEIEVCNGQADGDLIIDASNIATRISITADIAELSLETCVQQLPITLLSQGTASLQAEIAGEGRDAAELLAALGGKMKIKATHGSVLIDLGRAIAKQSASEEVWGNGGATAFTTLAADCQLTTGRVQCGSFDMETDDASVSGFGEVDLTHQMLDWYLFVSGNLISVAAPALNAGGPVTLSISGPWSQPTIRRAGLSHNLALRANLGRLRAGVP